MNRYGIWDQKKDTECPTKTPISFLIRKNVKPTDEKYKNIQRHQQDEIEKLFRS